MFVSKRLRTMAARHLARAAPSPTSFNKNPQGDEHLRIGRADVRPPAKIGADHDGLPMPTDYGRQVVELVWQYGQFRKYATRYPLGTLRRCLPTLKTSPSFGFIDQAPACREVAANPVRDVYGFEGPAASSAFLRRSMRTRRPILAVPRPLRRS